MTYEEIKTLFSQRYDQNNWKQFLGEAFVKSRLLTTPEILTGIDSNVALQVQKLGYITLNESGLERQIAVYEVILAKGIILERNRVGLRNLLRKYWKDIDAAFITYHSPDDSTNSSGKWRFTYVSELTGYDAEGEFIKIKTEPKRYTYVLGEGESTRTAAERFTALATKGSKATLDDIKEVFSVEKLSKAFFDEYKKHYDIFCAFMASKPNIQTIFEGNDKAIRDFNKKLLGRIVFLYFIQKKGWLGVPVTDGWGKGDFNFLTQQFENHQNKDLFYQDFLSKLFFDTLNTPRKDDLIELVKGEPCRIPYLNGGLFEEDDKNYRKLIFDATLFKNLFEFFNQYNFTIYEDDPNDHTIAVDPEMLGHIFENLLEDNKDKGAFYTPKEIVHYMCQESLIEYLASQLKMNGELKIERSSLEQLLKRKEVDDNIKPLLNRIESLLDAVKICDPAIGSGAFPMGLLQEIFTAKQTLYHFEHGNLINFPASDVKLNIIQNSIYGVDIEKGAVDIARLRFWLSLIVDEETPQALPNLDYKIVVGNSLVSKLGEDIIDIDWTLNETSYGLFGADLAKQKGDLLKKISTEQKEFFNPDSDKKKLSIDIRNLKIELLITQLELMVKTKGIEKQPNNTGKNIVKQTEIYSQTLGWKNSIKDLQKLKAKPELPLQFFDWKLDFPEVMNPILFEALFENSDATIRVANAQILALNKQIDAINLHLEQHNIDAHLIHLQANIAQGQIVIVKKQLAFVEQNITEIFGKINTIENNIVEEPDLGFAYNIASINSSIAEINERIEVVNPTIEGQNTGVGFDIVIGNPPYVVVNEKLYPLYNTAKCCDLYCYFFELGHNLLKKKSILSFITPSLFIKGLKFQSLHHLLLNHTNDLRIINKGDNVFNEVSMPTAITFFKKENPSKVYHWDDLFINNSITLKMRKNSSLLGSISKIQRGFEIGKDKTTKEVTAIKFITGTDVEKYNIKKVRYISEQVFNQYTKGDLEYYKSERVIIRETGSRITAIYLDKELYCNRSLYSILSNKSTDPKYLLGILSSNLMQYFYQVEFKADTEIFPKIRIAQVKQLPIKDTSKNVQKLIAKKVDQILALKSESEDSTFVEQQIDNLVYKLYELTYEEVKVIDPAFSLSQTEYEAIKLE